MVTTIVTHHTISTADSSVYLRLAYEQKPILGSEIESTPDTTIAMPDGPDPDFP